jgi:hypothetical protein
MANGKPIGNHLLQRIMRLQTEIYKKDVELDALRRKRKSEYDDDDDNELDIKRK